MPNDNPASSNLPARLRAGLAPRQIPILIAEDDAISAKILEATLSKLGYQPIIARNGREAWKKFDRAPLGLIISDWMMPELDGLGLCEKVRARPGTAYTYFILLTAKHTSPSNYEIASAAGVDDFLGKPLDRETIRIRLRVAERILKYTAEIRHLQEMIPVCVYCRKVRDEHDYWDRVETYIQKETGSRFTHAACPQCYEKEIALLADNQPNESKAAVGTLARGRE